jgi:hypothetical protein
VSVKQNIFSGIPSKLRDERIDELVASTGLRIPAGPHSAPPPEAEGTSKS